MIIEFFLSLFLHVWVSVRSSHASSTCSYLISFINTVCLSLNMKKGTQSRIQNFMKQHIDKNKKLNWLFFGDFNDFALELFSSNTALSLQKLILPYQFTWTGWYLWNKFSQKSEARYRFFSLHPIFGYGVFVFHVPMTFYSNKWQGREKKNPIYGLSRAVVCTKNEYVQIVLFPNGYTISTDNTYSYKITRRIHTYAMHKHSTFYTHKMP